MDSNTREKTFQLFYKIPLNHLVAKEGMFSVNVRAFSNLALEQYINNSVIDTAIARMHCQCNLKESALCLPVHKTTWINTGDEDSIHECFQFGPVPGQHE